MKEVTYEDWLKNPTPRSMWVWDKDEELKVKRKVIYVLKGGPCMYPVRVTTNDDTDYEAYIHCAEIEKQRRMTNREVADWLCEKPFREFRALPDFFSFKCGKDDEVREDVEIRENNGEWHEPLVEVVE